MSLDSFIPAIWSETLQRSMNEKYVGVANCTREYEGEIREKGSHVKILDLNDIGVSDYYPNSDLSSPDDLSGSAQDLYIDRAKCFNFQLDDVEHAQAVPTLMAAAMDKAAKALAKEADRAVYAQYMNTSFTMQANGADPDDILDAFIKTRTKLLENGVASADDIVFEISPLVAEKLFKAQINLTSDNTVLENGCIGKLAGCKVYVTNNITKMRSDGVDHHMCFARTRRAIAFAEQLSEIEAYRPETRFADAVKGLHLYGVKVIYPLEFGVVDVAFE